MQKGLGGGWQWDQGELQSDEGCGCWNGGTCVFLMPLWAESPGAHADWSRPGILCDLSQKASLGSITLGLRGREAAPGGVGSQQTLLRALKLGAFSMTHLPLSPATIHGPSLPHNSAHPTESGYRLRILLNMAQQPLGEGRRGGRGNRLPSYWVEVPGNATPTVRADILSLGFSFVSVFHV